MPKNNEVQEYNVYGYDPVKDNSPVDQFGFINLREAFVNHCIPGNLTVNTEDYNGVDDPSSLLGKSADIFEAYRKAHYVKSAELSAAKAEADAASSAVTE